MNNPALHILPIKRLIDILAEGNHHAAAIISSSSPIDEQKIPIPHHIEIYEDIDCEVAGRSFSSRAANEIASFVLSLPHSITDLYICCNAGESRSPAICAATLRHYGLDDMWIWESVNYHPNMLVFQKMAAAYQQPIDDDLADYLYYTNKSAFEEQIKKSRLGLI